MLDLIAKTCGALYRASTMGWNQRKKRGEMKLRDLKYLVVKRNGRGLGDREMSREREGKDVRGEEESGEKVEEHNEEVGKKRKRTADEDAEKETQKPKGSEEGEPLGFASFMPTYEDGKKVLYIYEIHLEEELRGFVPTIHFIPPHALLPPELPSQINIPFPEPNSHKP
ncbi:hypothetical protein ACMFMG_010675 [Clarireedia jacksonii]